MGMEVDDLLIDLSASIADVVNSSAVYIQEDAVRPHILKESDVIISDLPVGYYPNDEIASRFKVAATGEHTYAHHLLMEQSLKYLKKDGIAILLAPTNLLTSPQSDLLKKWLSGYADIIAVITLPEAAFGNKRNMKSIFVLKNKLKMLLRPLFIHLAICKTQRSSKILQRIFKNGNQIIPFSSKTC